MARRGQGPILDLTKLLIWTVSAGVKSWFRPTIPTTVSGDVSQYRAPLQGAVFAHIDEDGDFRPIDYAEYYEFISELQIPAEEARDLIKDCQSRNNSDEWPALLERLRDLSNDMKWHCDEFEDLEIKFRRAADRDRHHRIIVRERHLATYLAAAVETGVSPAVLRQTAYPLKGRFRIGYINADDWPSDRYVKAIGYSTIGDRAYLWAFCENDKAVRQFRADRIQTLRHGKLGKIIRKEDVPVWLLQKAQRQARRLAPAERD